MEIEKKYQSNSNKIVPTSYLKLAAHDPDQILPKETPSPSPFALGGVWGNTIHPRKHALDLLVTALFRTNG